MNDCKEEFITALNKLVKDSGLKFDLELYTADTHGTRTIKAKPGFDCDDYASAAANYLANHFNADKSFTVFYVRIIYDKAQDLPTSHLMVVVKRDNAWWIIDPLTEIVSAECTTRGELAAEAGRILTENYETRDGTTFQCDYNMSVSPLLNLDEPAPWYTDGEMRSKFNEYMNNKGKDPRQYYPATSTPVASPNGQGLRQ